MLGLEAVTDTALIIMRHAKSDWSSGARSDYDRPLAGRGRKAIPLMAAWLDSRGLVPDRIIASPARRAAETAAGLVRELGLDEDLIRWDERIYGATPGELLRVIEAHAPGARRLLLVGHNPGLDGVLEYLSAGRPPRNPAGKLLTTAAVAVLGFDEGSIRTDPGSGCLQELVRPSELKQGVRGGG